jgi:hypothetical protein
MAWTYDETALDTPLNRMRLAIGDTLSNRPLLKDEEITKILSEETEFYVQAAACCHLICALFAGKPERFRLEEYTESLRTIYDRYEKMATKFAGRSGGSPWAASIDVAEKDATVLDTTLVTPLFKRGIHDN